ncbi:MAG: hypothetical protein SOT80_06085 [Candidatus Pseudoruminococcus sp.]|nr:hypothetical protein [Ruminococcus sp.]MDY2782959.1 hypothetical protein [Candidatus Pseudoruminococcus sp.]
MLFKKDKSIHMSIPKSYSLYGVTIRKLPIAKYIAVLREVNDLPSLLLGELFPEGSNLNDALERLQNIDRSTTLALIGRLLKIVPEEFCKVLSKLLDISEERLLDVDCENPLSLSELAEIIEAFWKVNDMSDFLMTVQSLSRRAAPTRSKANTGFSDGSQ